MEQAGVRRGGVAGLALAVGLAALGMSAGHGALPALAVAFGAGVGQVQWVVLAYLLATTVVIVGAGRLGDRAGRRRVLGAGIGLFALGGALAALAPTLALLIAARAVQGAGAAAMMALAPALVGGIVAPERIGRAMGLMGTASAVGTALGPGLGGVLIAGFGWRAVFWLTVVLAGLAAGLVWRGLPGDRPGAAAPGRGDPWGMVVLAVSLALYALGLGGGFGLAGWGLLGLALAGAGLFGAVEARVAAPLIAPWMLGEADLGPRLAMSALVAAVMMASLVAGPFHLSAGLGLGPLAVGLGLAVGPGVAALVGLPAGRLVDRLGAGAVGLAGLGAMAAAAISLALMPLAWGLAGYLGAIAGLTGGYALFQAANTAAVLGSAGAARRGMVSGLLTLSRNLGLITGAAAIGAVFAWAGSGDAAGGLHASFALASLWVLVALALAAGGPAVARRGLAALWRWA